jgi:hypothetical protein
MRSSGLEPPRAIRSQGPQPGTRGGDASSSVQIVQIARIAGPIGRIGRDGRCQSVVTARLAASGGIVALVDRGPRLPRYVVIPCGGGGVSLISFARIGVQRSGGQRAAKMNAMRPSGRAALGASNPAQPSRERQVPGPSVAGRVIDRIARSPPTPSASAATSPPDRRPDHRHYGVGLTRDYRRFAG